MQFIGPKLSSDENADYYGGFEDREKNIYKVYDYVLFKDKDTCLNYVGKIHSPFYDKNQNTALCEIQLFLETPLKERTCLDYKELYCTDTFVEIPIEKVLRSVKCLYIPKNINNIK